MWYAPNGRVELRESYLTGRPLAQPRPLSRGTMVAEAPPPSGNGTPAGGADDKKSKAPPVELSAEDQELKDNLLLCVQRVSDPDPGVARLALETLRTEIRTATRCVPSGTRPTRW